MKAMVLCVMVVLLAGGCATAKVAQAKVFAYPDGTGEAIWSDGACQELMEKRDNSLLAGKILAGLVGVGGVTSAIPLTDSETTKGKVVDGVVGGATAAAGIVSGALIIYSQNKSEAFEQFCEVRP